METPNGAVLTAHEATVQTAQVEIRVMKVGKKQVTMGMFRQLPLRRILLPEDTLFLGDPWGHVNYWWDGDGRHSLTPTSSYTDMTALHVVWSQGGRLYRDVVYRDPAREYCASLLGERKRVWVHVDEMWDRYTTDGGDSEAYSCAWAEQWASLCRMPQLFIAV